MVIMVAAISESKTPSLQNPSNRPPLLPSERDNNGVLPRRPRARQVSSRYLSPSPSTSTSTSTSTTTTTTSSSSSSSSSRRFPSPLLSRSNNSNVSRTTPLPSSAPKRAQSADRRRPIPSRSVTPQPDSRQSNAGEMSAATKLLITSSRSLSVSFQGEAFSLPISKAKTASPCNASNARKGTPERRRATPLRGKGDGGGDQAGNSKPMDQHRWPARARQVNSNSNPLSRSLNYSSEKKDVGGFGSGMATRSLQLSIIDDRRRASFDGRLSLDLGNAELLKADALNLNGNMGNEPTSATDLTASDTDSVSSGSNSGVQEPGAAAKPKTVLRGTVVSARFWQETNSRLRRLQDPGSPLSTSPSSRAAIPAKIIQSKRFSSDNPMSSPRTMASPLRGSARPASPSKLWASTASPPSRGSPSPSRVRNSVMGSLNNSNMNSPSILSFSVDLRRTKVGEDRIADAHMLRLLYNRHLQWRFVNARADATCKVQRLIAEKNMWNAWVTISELRHSVTLKRIKLLLLRQKLKLASILKRQMAYMEEWSLLEKDHSNSLVGASEALKASTLRLPLADKAVADVQNLKEAISSSVDVMQAMASAICPLSSKVEEMNTVVAELVSVTAKEQLLLDQCKDFLSVLAAMQVKDCSLRTQVIQRHRAPTSISLTTHVYN